MTGKTGSFARSNSPTPVSGNVFNADNEMTAFGSDNLVYDANGNLINDGSNAYIWVERNHLKRRRHGQLCL